MNSKGVLVKYIQTIYDPGLIFVNTLTLCKLHTNTKKGSFERAPEVYTNSCPFYKM